MTLPMRTPPSVVKASLQLMIRLRTDRNGLCRDGMFERHYKANTGSFDRLLFSQLRMDAASNERREHACTEEAWKRAAPQLHDHL